MVLKLVGSKQSTCTRRVAAVCKELGIPYQLVEVNFAVKEHKSAPYLEKQPFGQVPYIDDDGFILYESRAICRYLAVKSGSPLIPKQTDLKKYAKFEVACSNESANFDPFASDIVFEKLFKGYLGLGETDTARVAKLEQTLEAKLTAYDAILSKQKYLAGDELTLADLFHLPYGWMCEANLGYKFFQTKPNVARWWNEISSRSAWQSTKDGA